VEFALQMNIQVLVLDTMQMASQGFISDENNNTEMASFYEPDSRSWPRKQASRMC
jgi:hypothetical protein